MTETIERKSWPLVRFIVPASPEVNIFTRPGKITTALGLVMVATAANKLWGLKVEIIDENNYRKGPKDKNGLPDHVALQKENPAVVVCFYCGLSSTMERVWELAKLYKVAAIAGGWHAHYCPEETLKHNIDVVVHGDGELVIRQIIEALKEKRPLADIPGISFMENGKVKTNPPEMLEVSDLNGLPYPDFGLLRYAKIKIYPIGRIRGCSMNCEFCSVRGKPRWATADYFFNLVKWLRETRKAQSFFIVDDRSEEDLGGTIEFFRMISEKYGSQLNFTIQMRLEAAKNIELLEIMKKAGVRTVCVGYESPIDRDLRAMRKGYSSSLMLKWTKILRSYFWVHGMFIVSYPSKNKKNPISAKETIKCFRRFIRKASLDTVQILLPVPVVGTDLRKRLEKEGRVFPLELVSWGKYDGNFPCFMPDDMTLQEFQEIPMKIMSRFYNPSSFIRIPLRTVSLPVDYFIRGWKGWYRGWSRDVIKYGGHLLLLRWLKKQEGNGFIKRLEEYSLRK